MTITRNAVLQLIDPHISMVHRFGAYAPIQFISAHAEMHGFCKLSFINSSLPYRKLLPKFWLLFRISAFEIMDCGLKYGEEGHGPHPVGWMLHTVVSLQSNLHQICVVCASVHGSCSCKYHSTTISSPILEVVLTVSLMGSWTKTGNTNEISVEYLGEDDRYKAMGLPVLAYAGE